jgi:hypothetical protein
VSAFLEPRVVESPYRKRWVRAALQLFVRSPLRFGVLIATLAWLDVNFLAVFHGSRVPDALMKWLGLMTLPLVWAVASALARGADDRSQTLSAFAGFLRLRLWASILFAGALIVCVLWTIDFLFDSILQFSILNHETRVSRSGQLLGAIGGQALLVYCFCGPCLLPLLVLMPALSFEEARRLSNRAAEINDWQQFLGLLLRLFCVAAIMTFLPAYGLSEAAWMVFMGVLNYVAYRDIFERRPGNLPQEAAVPSPGKTPAVADGAPT